MSATRRLQANDDPARLRCTDRLFWVGLARIWAGWRQSLVIVTPETVLRWQRRRFREYWTELSGRSTGGRPPINAEIRALITRIATANPLWGAPRIHGELLKLGIDVAERTVSRLMPTRRPHPSQTWRTFLANHVRDLVSIDFFTVPTARLRVLFVLVVLAHHRRRVVHFTTRLWRRTARPAHRRHLGDPPLRRGHGTPGRAKGRCAHGFPAGTTGAAGEEHRSRCRQQARGTDHGRSTSVA